MAKIEKEAVKLTWSGIILFYNLFTLFSCVKKIAQSCDMLGCWAVDLANTKRMGKY